MQRNISDSSTNSISRIRRRLSSIRTKAKKGPPSPQTDVTPTKLFIQELDATETATLPASDSVEDVSDDPSYQQLRDNIRRLRGASLGVNGVDSTFSAYSRCSEQSLELCKSLAKKSKTLAFSSTYDIKGVGDRQGERNDNGFLNPAWLTAIHDFKAYQEGLLEHLRESITATYKKYEPDATTHQVEMLFSDREFRGLALARVETARNTRPPYETPAFWHEYVERFRNYDKLKLDLLHIELICATIESDKGPSVSIREYDIAANGDAILEFANSVSEVHPVLRFRVSSYILIEASPFFARILSSSRSDSISPLEMLEGSPPPPLRQVCRDGTEVKVYRMPQLELNKLDSLTTLLHAAHMHNDQIPREIKFDEFVSIAEVCLRYHCTGPLEMAVEYCWLPQWIHKASEASPDGFVLISYVFGLRRLFTRTSKSAILNITSNKELERKELWPREVKKKIGAVREAKLAQIYTACANLMKEYVRMTPHMLVMDKDGDGALTSTPKCPKGLHQCDAANLGWLMLVYSELGILPDIMDTMSGRYPFVQSGRSISGLVQSLSRMPSPPQLHSGICDYARPFRSAINDIYNSITGLTLRDVSGTDGWALSKEHDLGTKFSEDALREVFELPAPVERKDPVVTEYEAINLRILSHLDDLQDLHATAIVNKSFYSTFKKHEIALMRNLIKAGKRRATDSFMSGTQEPPNRGSLIHQTTADRLLPVRLAREYKAEVARRLPLSPETSREDLCGTTRPNSSFIPSPELHISSAEVEDIPWVSVDGTGCPLFEGLDKDVKFLSSDVVHVDKSLVVEGRKHLRDEQDRNLRVGLLAVAQTS